MGGDTGTKVTEEQLAQFEVGKTTEAEIIARIGKPSHISISPDGNRHWLYMGMTWGINSSLLPTRTKLENTQATLVISKEGVLVDMVGTETRDESTWSDTFRPYNAE